MEKVDFDAEFGRVADVLRYSLDSSEYKHAVLGLIFLKYISDVFDVKYAELEAKKSEGADPEDPDEYRAARTFWLPKEARWSTIKAASTQSNIGEVINSAMLVIELEHPRLKDVLPKEYADPRIDKKLLGMMVDHVGQIGFSDGKIVGKDVLGRAYEFFLSKFASVGGKRSGQYYTPRSIVRLLVGMLAPYQGTVYDPCCGSGGMFVQSMEFIKEHSKNTIDATTRVFGQELSLTTWRMANMNLLIHGIYCDLGKGPADTFLNDQHPYLRADFILANPPFNMHNWGHNLLKTDPRWIYGLPPAGNANYAWLQHIIYHLSNTGTAGVVLANGSMSSNLSGEGEIRKKIIEADLVDCMVALPDKLFYATSIPVCLWFIAKNKSGGSAARMCRDRRGQTLFIDARELGELIDRNHRELTDDDIQKITSTYHAWRGDELDNGRQSKYEDVPGFCKSVAIEEIRDRGFVLVPGFYVGAPESSTANDDETFDEKMRRLVTQLREQKAEAAKLDAMIAKNLEDLGYEM